MSDINFNLPPGSRAHGIKRKRIETPSQIALRNAKAAERKKVKRKNSEMTPALKVFTELGQQLTNDACLEYIRCFQGNRISQIRPDGWLSSPSPLSWSRTC